MIGSSPFKRTVEASKVRDAAYSDFDRLDALWIEKNRALGDILIDIQDAGATDQSREAALTRQTCDLVRPSRRRYDHAR